MEQEKEKKPKVIVKDKRDGRYYFATPELAAFDLCSLKLLKQFMDRHKLEFEIINDTSTD